MGLRRCVVGRRYMYPMQCEWRIAAKAPRANVARCLVATSGESHLDHKSDPRVASVHGFHEKGFSFSAWTLTAGRFILLKRLYRSTT
jgi:hypothetical protein